MERTHAIALTSAGPVFGRVNLVDGQILHMAHPLALMERPGQVGDASGTPTIERLLVPILGSVKLDDVMFGPPWALVEDKKLADMHDQFCRRANSGLVLARGRVK